jgi:hypothetical protein
MHRVAAAAAQYARAERLKGRAASMSARALDKLEFVGEDNVKNLSAVKNLMSMSRRRVYASYGSRSGLESVLPGVTVTVLGPPTLEQTDGIRTMRARDKDEFWQLLSGKPRATEPLVGGVSNGASATRRRRESAALPSNARWFARRLSAMRGSQILEIVTALDEQMNNTSLVLLFEFGGRKLLFPGDAQLENWRYALAEVGKGAEARKNVERLKDIDFYKVGHHGSLNATPKQMLWSNLENRNKPGDARLRTMLSTMPGKHPGRVGGIGEVPRKPLLEALEAETALLNTDRLRKTKNPGTVEWCHELTITARR